MHLRGDGIGERSAFHLWEQRIIEINAYPKRGDFGSQYRESVPVCSKYTNYVDQARAFKIEFENLLGSNIKSHKQLSWASISNTFFCLKI